MTLAFVAPVAVPSEIVSMICDEVEGTGTLAILCRTSPSFRAQAQHILYHSVDLSQREMPAVKSWARSVARNAHLAERVYSLSLRLPTRTLDISDATKIMRALDGCINLKILKVECADLRPRLNSTHLWMIDSCSFRLHEFSNHYFTTEDQWITKFWKTQTEIRVLSFPQRTIHFPLPAQYLPNLVAVNTPNLSELPPDRPLQRIRTDLHRDVSHLARYAQSLRTLDLTRTWLNDYITWFDTIQIIADSLPLLCHLWLLDSWKYSGPSTGLSRTSEQAPTTAIHCLSQLQTFVLHVRNTVRFVSDNDIEYLMDVPADMEALGMAIITAHPTLRRTNLGGEVVKEQELTCILRRTSEGGFHVEHGTQFDSDAFSMF